MKRIGKILLLLVVLCCFYYNVDAKDYKVKELISVSDTATVKTDTFTYNNIKFVPLTEDAKYAKFNFESVVNNTDKSIPVSIDILLFDKEQKNIGFVTYCSKKDFSSDYANFELKGKATTSFSINIEKRYYVVVDEKKEIYKEAKDISYYSILDENIYCHIGGYDKYKGLTLDEIDKGELAEKKTTPTEEISILKDSIDFKGLLKYAIILIAVYGVTGIILNELDKRMNATSSPIAYLPIGNNYVSMKLAFGDLIAKIYVICLFISIVLYVLSIRFLLYVFGFASSVAFIIDIVKLIFEPVTHNYVGNNSNVESVPSNDNIEVLSEDQINSTGSDTNTASSGENLFDSLSKENEPSAGSGNETIDLNYSAPAPEGTLPTNTTANTPIDENSNNNKDGESDLSNFFR